MKAGDVVIGLDSLWKCEQSETKTTASPLALVHDSTEYCIDDIGAHGDDASGGDIRPFQRPEPDDPPLDGVYISFAPLEGVIRTTVFHSTYGAPLAWCSRTRTGRSGRWASAGFTLTPP